MNTEAEPMVLVTGFRCMNCDRTTSDGLQSKSIFGDFQRRPLPVAVPLAKFRTRAPRIHCYECGSTGLLFATEPIQ